MTIYLCIGTQMVLLYFGSLIFPAKNYCIASQMGVNHLMKVAKTNFNCSCHTLVCDWVWHVFTEFVAHYKFHKKSVRSLRKLLRKRHGTKWVKIILFPLTNRYFLQSHVSLAFGQQPLFFSSFFVKLCNCNVNMFKVFNSLVFPNFKCSVLYLKFYK